MQPWELPADLQCCLELQLHASRAGACWALRDGVALAGASIGLSLPPLLACNERGSWWARRRRT